MSEVGVLMAVGRLLLMLLLLHSLDLPFGSIPFSGDTQTLAGILPGGRKPDTKWVRRRQSPVNATARPDDHDSSPPIDPNLPYVMKQKLLRVIRDQEQVGYHNYMRQINLARKKRDYDHVGEFMPCPKHAQWVTIDTSVDFYNYPVELYDESGYTHQFYQVTCDYEMLAVNNSHRPTCEKCCIAVNNDVYINECKSLRNYHPVKVKSTGAADYRWTFIAVHSGCGCHVLPRDQVDDDA